MKYCRKFAQNFNFDATSYGDKMLQEKNKYIYIYYENHFYLDVPLWIFVSDCTASSQPSDLTVKIL